MTPARVQPMPDGVGQRVGQRLPARVLVDRHQRGHAAAGLELAPHQVPGRLGRHHGHVHARRRHDLAEVDVEPVGEHQRLARAEAGPRPPRRSARPSWSGTSIMITSAAGRRVGDRPDVEAGRLGRVPRAAARPQADDDLGAAVAQVEGVGVALAAVADDGEGAAGEAAAVGVGVVVHAHGIVRHGSVSR